MLEDGFTTTRVKKFGCLVLARAKKIIRLNLTLQKKQI